MSHWVCSICGYTHYNEKADSPCPICGSTASAFDQVSDDDNVFVESTPVTESVMIEPLEEEEKASYPSGWNNWSEKPVSHSHSLQIMKDLRNHTDSIRNKLINVQKDLDRSKEDSCRIFESVTDTAKRQCEDKIKIFTQVCETDIQSTLSRAEKASHVSVAAYDFKNNDLAHNIWLFFANRKASEILSQMEAWKIDFNRAINEKINSYKLLRDSLIEESNAELEKKLNTARKEQISRDEHAERIYEERIHTIEEAGRNDFETGFNRSTIEHYGRTILSSRFNTLDYVCAKDVPDIVMFGNIGLRIKNESQEDMVTVQALELQTVDIGVKQDEQYIVRMPYAQRLSDGLSLMINYEESERSYAQSLLQPLLLKLFMLFPPGKLETTMIDPLDIGGNFPDIPRLATSPNAARFIDTRIWSKEKDIESAIAALRQQMEDIMQSYGSDRESRLKKEPIRVLVVTDFPSGFNDAALKDFHAIVRNSAALGVCVLICSNKNELEKLKAHHDMLVSEITQSIVQTDVRDNKLWFLESSGEGIFLELDDMQDVMARKDFFIKTLNYELERAGGIVEDFINMYDTDVYDSNSWFHGSSDEVDIPIGIKGASTVVKMVLGRGGGSTEHHALIVGPTGAGKSTFLHTLIMNTMINYSPYDVQLYLLDFKEGIEFNVYTQYRLPSLRVVAINSEREFGLTVLEELCDELQKRAKLFARYGKNDILGYHELFDVPNVPKLLLVFDEVQELFRRTEESDSISERCLSCLSLLLSEGRAMGIHIILASQDFRNCGGLNSLFVHMAIRVIIKGSEDSAAAVLDSDNTGLDSLRKRTAGAAIYNNNGGKNENNNFFQICWIKEDARKALLAQMDAYFSDPQIAEKYSDCHTRLMLTNVEDDVHNSFNNLIQNGYGSYKRLSCFQEDITLVLGQGFGKSSVFQFDIASRNKDNVLMIGRDVKIALSLFDMSVLSILHECLDEQKSNPHTCLYVINLMYKELGVDDCDLSYLDNLFQTQMESSDMKQAAALIETIYQMILRRAESEEEKYEKVFFLFFGIDLAINKFTSQRMYDEYESDSVTVVEMLKTIFQKGHKYGIVSIAWSESIQDLERLLGSKYESYFNKRIAFNLGDDDMGRLVAEKEPKSVQNMTAVYMDVDNDIKNTHFRPYDIPSKYWVERFAESYSNIINSNYEGE